ncbi:hypothetical protein [Parafilimonas sp.]|uniref:hypothetical protein n=1 Tax=Parafilimonas sp. TaxID=1969739 RepID=UPI0039E479E1
MKRIFNWERWPFNIIYAPFFFLWLYYWIKGGHFWFFSNVNPTLHFSGFEGETKREMFEQLPKALYPVTMYVDPKENMECIIKRMQASGLQFPVAVKPDIGTKGLLFRKIENTEQLAAYHALLPFTYLIQEMITWPLELSVFYVRYPHSDKGIITGLIEKEYLHVKGDGISTLKRLIEQHPKAFMIAAEQKELHKTKLNNIIADGEVYMLNELGNHNRGAKFINLSNKIDDQLSNVMDKINLFSKHFYYGRYDIKTTSLEDFKHCRNISILEFNGVGSEPNHIYDNGLSYMNAIKIIAKHWKYMFGIGKINYKNGAAYVSFFEGIKMLRASKKNTKLMAQLNLQCQI